MRSSRTRSTLSFSPRVPDPQVALEVVRVSRDRPFFSAEPHAHRFFEVFFLDGGRGWHQQGADRRTVGRGDLLVVPPGEVHDTGGLGRVTGWLVLFEASALEGARPAVTLPGPLAMLPFVRAGASRAAFRVPRASWPSWFSRLRGLHDELSARRPGYEVVARADLEATLVLAARVVAPHLGLRTATLSPLVAKALQFIDARSARPIALIDVARAVGRSPAHLTSTVKAQTGRSVGQWILARRMAEARRLLRETSLTVAAIGEAVGFLDPSYFVRRFRAEHRQTPAAWRRGA